MSLIIAAALAASPATTANQPVPAAAPPMHAHQAQRDAKAKADGCACCKKMAEGGKMDCCAEHGKGHGVESKEHSAQ